MVKKLVMGNEAFAYAALSAGVRVVAGYPGTPSSEVIETIAKEQAQGRAEDVYVEWSSNEKVALELLAGASLGGARCLFTCKQVGLNVASDALLSLNYVGIKGGLVLFVADDPGPLSSQTEQDTRRFADFAKVPVLDPSTVEQGYDMMQVAFELSETYQTPVIVRSSTRISHASAFMDIAEQTQGKTPTGFEKSPRWVIFPRRAYQAHGEINERLRAIAEDYAQPPYSTFNEITLMGGTDKASSGSAEKPSMGICAGGVSASYVLEALSIIEEQLKALNRTLPLCRFMQVGTPYPFAESLAGSFTEGLDQVLVFEELDHVIEDRLLALCGKTKGSYEVLGKLTGHTRDRGENTVDDTYERLLDFLQLADLVVDREESTKSFAQQPELPMRPPVLCAGCPHRGSFYAIKRALRKMKHEAIFCGDIGCYTLGNALPLDAVDTCLCMGAGISMAQGFSVVEKDKKQLAFVGDSTFFASGLPGLVNAIYNQHDITVVVLDNSITAMTGAQPHPGTGDTLMGAHHPGVSIEAILRAIGFDHIEQANPFDLVASMDAAQKALSVEGPSVILYKAPCITLIKPDLPLVISKRCTGCRYCITEIGCPALAFDADEKRVFVNKDLCTGCGLCIEVCPFHAISHQKSGENHA